ncbi:MAG TPA: crosslink repair DNA glycosylase YcaQ family protein [Candidatus Limnocylindrales bacterium]|nr:crosslink repair DNA glycosylase YcaQ family protein [Candidatus Limnocylindrales bacterium]
MRSARLALGRDEILAFRRHVAALDERLPMTVASLRRAAWAGLQDSMPRAALLSIHARVESTRPTTWQEPPLVQTWGPRFSAYVVASDDLAPFTLGRLPDDEPRRRRAYEIAARLRDFLGGRRMSYADAGRGIGLTPNALRYAAPTGSVLIRWEGARRPLIWTVPPPAVEPLDARLELVRRYLHAFGPATPDAFEEWAGLRRPAGSAAFTALGDGLVPVRTPIGDAWILATDEAEVRGPTEGAGGAAPARLLPSGDTFFLLWGRSRELLVPDGRLRSLLWTSRVWPGALLVGGEVAGTWRRSDTTVTIAPWRRLDVTERSTVEAEAASLPLPDARGAVAVRWEGPVPGQV